MKCLHLFFERYAAALTAADINTLTDSFADQFMTTEQGIYKCVKNDQVFRQALGRSIQLYRRLGLQSINIAAYEESEKAIHMWAVQIEWKLRHLDGRTFGDFVNTYFVQLVNEEPKIILLRVPQKIHTLMTDQYMLI